MSEGGAGPARARLLDLFRPARLYAGLPDHPRFVVPTALLVGAAILYSQVALGVALPKLLPGLLERSTSTESALARDFRMLVVALGALLPWFFVAFFGFGSWATLRALGRRIPFVPVLALFAFASLWAAMGLLAKTGLVLATGEQEPPVNLTLLLEHPSRMQRIVLAFTNPFLLLAMIWNARGLRAWGAGSVASLAAGAGPWIAWIALSASGAGGATGRLAPAGPVSTEGWLEIDRPSLVMEVSPDVQASAERFADLLQEFTDKLAERFDLTPDRIRIRVFTSHTDLERATGEFLHVKLTGSIRGRDLLFLELPGRSVALPEGAGLHEALRYVALMRLSVADGLRDAPRWFVEGVAHAAAIPFTPQLEEEYLAALRRDGVPPFDALMDPATFRTPEGPLFARSVVDHLVYRHGPTVLDDIRHDLAGGAQFRDALFARTRLTTSALESEWQDAAARALGSGSPVPPEAAADSAAPGPAAPDSTAPGSLSPFLERQ